MRLMLVKPGIGESIEGYRLNVGRMEPLPLGILAGLTPPDVEVLLRDDRVDQIPFDEPVDLVAITVDSFTARRAYAISDEFRKRGVRVVLGGIHVTLLPGEAAAHADSIVIGDAEPVWGRLLNDVRRGRMRPRYAGAFGRPQEGVIPRRTIFRGKGYLPVSLVQFSRGCPFHCSFCSVARFFRNSHHCRAVEEVVREIEHDDLRMILFTDDNLTANKAQAKELFRALKPLKVRWASQVSIDVVNDPELLELMADSGCMGQLIGFESLSPESLRWMKKGHNLRTHDMYRKAVECMRQYGFQTWASFLLGSDYDSVDSINRTIEFAIESKFTLAFFHILMPYPGTALYSDLAKAGRLLFGGRWWLHPDFHYNTATFVPRLLTPEQLGEAAVRANRQFYSMGSIFSRLLDRQTNISSLRKFLLFARFNLLVRQTST